MLSSVLSKSCFRFRIGLTSYYTRCTCMSGGRLRPRKIAGKAEKKELKTREESAMSDAILEELKSLRSDLARQMQKISDELVTFEGSTDVRLAKIKSVISKIDEIDDLKPKVEKLEDVGGMKQSVSITLNETRNLFQECNVELKTRVASKMTLAKLRMPTILEENARKKQGILLSNSMAALSSESYFLSPRIRKTSKP